MLLFLSECVSFGYIGNQKSELPWVRDAAMS